MGDERAELFGFFGPPSSTGERIRNIAGRLRRLKDRLTFSVLLSLAAHAVLIGAMTVFRGDEAVRESGARFSEFRKALGDLEATFPDPENLAALLAEVTEEDYFEAFEKDLLLDDRLTGSERISATKVFLSEALSRFRKRAGGRSALDASLNDFFGSPGEGPEVELDQGARLFRMRDALLGTTRFFRLSRENRVQIEAFTAGGEGSPSSTENFRVQTGRNLSKVPLEYFFRGCPYERMLAVGSRHFYAVRGFPEVGAPKPEAESGDPSTVRKIEERRSPPVPAVAQPAFRVIYLPSSSLALSASPKARSRLNLTDAALDRILDGLMTLPDEAQVEAFVRDYLEVYDPDDPGLARLTREFIYRNLGMVFMLADPLSTGFDFLEEIHYDMFSMGGIVAFGLRNSRTLTGTEILFCLAASYEFESRAIGRLEGALDSARAILDGGAPPEVHSARAKAFTLREVYRELAADLRRQGFDGLDAILEAYEKEQEKIYEFIAAGDLEARNRALFALGSLYWAAGRREAAIEKWRAVGPEFAPVAMDQIRGILHAGEISEFRVSRIDRVLQARASADRNELLARLKKFHKWSVRSEGLDRSRSPESASRSHGD